MSYDPPMRSLNRKIPTTILVALLALGFESTARAEAPPAAASAPTTPTPPPRDIPIADWRAYPWLSTIERPDPLSRRFLPPAGYQLVPLEGGSFGAWLRTLPLRPEGWPVHLFDGSLKANRDAAAGVVWIDVGRQDLQQCADAVIRLRAEFLFSRPERHEEICFHFTNGVNACWHEWAAGRRPFIDGNSVTWKEMAPPREDHVAFRGYLSNVFEYAGTLSLAKELDPVKDATRVEPGDVFIHGGSPGHAVLVVDVAANTAGERMFLLAQSYMPAQEIHVLTNPATPGSAWYPARASGALDTPEWRFDYRELRRFPGR